MIQVYCNEGQLEANITIEGIKYETNNPPLKVDLTYNGVITYWDWLSNYNVATYQETYSSDIIKLGDTSDIFNISYENDGTIIWGQESGGRNVYSFIYKVTVLKNGVQYYQNSHPVFGTLPVFRESPNTNKYTLTAKDNNNINIVTIMRNEPIFYLIKCDGCKPGECKGKQSKYPGYVCLDCKKMISQSINMRNRLNGIR